MKELFIASCTRARKEETDLYRSLHRLRMDRFMFFENNEAGLSTCYNSVLNERAGRDEIVLFVHDDVAIGDIFLEEKIARCFDHHGYAIAGLCGTADFRIDPAFELTAWQYSPPQAWSGALEVHFPGASPELRFFGKTPRRCVVLDGFFLAIDLKQAGHLRFDEQFDFHFYDLDFCLTAHQAGVVLGTTYISVTHRSPAAVTPVFMEGQKRFRAKWKAGQYWIDVPGEASPPAPAQ